MAWLDWFRLELLKMPERDSRVSEVREGCFEYFIFIRWIKLSDYHGFAGGQRNSFRSSISRVRVRKPIRMSLNLFYR